MILLYLSVTLNNNLFAGLSGRLFEAEAYTILCEGGWFPLNEEVEYKRRGPAVAKHAFFEKIAAWLLLFRYTSTK